MRIIILICMLGCCSASLACDHCNVFIGVNPNDFNHSIQLLYRFNQRQGTFNALGTLQKHGGTHSSYINTDVQEYYTTVELRGTYFLHPRWSLLASVPFRNSYRSVGGKRKADIYAVGDPILLTNYRLINSKSTDSTKWKHRLEVLGGLKFPLGKTDVTWNEKVVDHDLQPGTGSFDFIVGGAYTVLRRSIGLTLRGNWKLNGISKNDFRYGTSTNLEGNFFVNKEVKAFRLIPYIGTYYEAKGFDYFGNQSVVNSDVSTVYGRLGCTTFWKQLSIRIDYLTPLHQKVEGQNLLQGQQFNTTLSYFFN